MAQHTTTAAADSTSQRDQCAATDEPPAFADVVLDGGVGVMQQGFLAPAGPPVQLDSRMHWLFLISAFIASKKPQDVILGARAVPDFLTQKKITPPDPVAVHGRIIQPVLNFFSQAGRNPFISIEHEDPIISGLGQGPIILRAMAREFVLENA